MVCERDDSTAGSQSQVRLIRWIPVTMLPWVLALLAGADTVLRYPPVGSVTTHHHAIAKVRQFGYNKTAPAPRPRGPGGLRGKCRNWQPSMT
jgi:hypothetical protein